MKKPVEKRTPLPLLRKLVNGVFFYVVWFICVASGVKGSWSYVPAVLLALLVHFVLSPTKRLDFQVLMMVLGLGLIADTMYLQLGAIRFTTENPFCGGIAPLWVLGIYAVFATTLTGALSWLNGRFLLAAILGAGGGAISYAYGAEVGAATLNWGFFPTLALIGAVWFFLTPSIFYGIDKLASNGPFKL